MSAYNGAVLLLTVAIALAVWALIRANRTRPAPARTHVHAILRCATCEEFWEGVWESVAAVAAVRAGWVCPDCTDTLARLDQEASA